MGRTAASFADTHYAVAPDLRGFNLSSQPTEVAAYRAREIVGDLERFVAHLGFDRAIVVAHDWGGAVAWQWAIARPERVSKLVILNSPHPVPFARELASNPVQQRASAYMNWLRAPGAEGALAKDDFVRLDEFFLGMQRADAPWYTAGAPGPVPRGVGARAHGRPELLPCVAALSADGRRSGRAGDATEAADFRVRVPTLVIWGEADTALPVTLLDGLMELVDDLTVHRLPRATHWLAHEEPGEVARLIFDFIGR